MRRLLALTIGMVAVGLLSFALADDGWYCGNFTEGCPGGSCIEVAQGGVCLASIDPPIFRPFNRYTAVPPINYIGECMEGEGACVKNKPRCFYTFYQLNNFEIECEGLAPTCVDVWVDPNVCSSLG